MRKDVDHYKEDSAGVLKFHHFTYGDYIVVIDRTKLATDHKRYNDKKQSSARWIVLERNEKRKIDPDITTINYWNFRTKKDALNQFQALVDFQIIDFENLIF